MPTAQHIMLAVHCKKTEQVDLKGPILSYIRSTYSGAEADGAADDLAAVQGLRNEMVTAQGSATGTPRKEQLVKYFKGLANVETRFPISGERGHVKLSFPWFDAFRPAKKTSQHNIHFEKSAVLFNLAAVMSQEALRTERGSTEGITQACKLFQESAGVFGFLREHEANKVDAPVPVDVNSECLGMMERLMLAQAQECVYHKAVMDGKTPSTIARLAKQAAAMYGEVCASFAAPALQSHFEKSWPSHCQMKGSLLDVLALVEQAKQLQSETSVAKEIATLSEGFTRLQATKKLAKAVSQELADSLRPLEESMALALRKAQRDNDAVYLEKVPPFADLPPLQGALLVKSAPPANLEADGESLFSGLVPDASAKALSKYSDAVDAAVREALDKLAGATDAARVALRQAELPELLEALDGATPAAAVPEGLKRELEEIQTIGGSSHLRGILSEMGELRRNVEADLAACQRTLEDEAAADASARAEFKDRWGVPASATLARNLADKIASYRSTLVQAGESDARVIARLNENEGAFAALTPEAAASQMPRLSAPLVPLGPEDPAVVAATLRRDVEALSALSTERAGIEEALKELKSKDNILPKLMGTPTSGYDALFEKELAKYSKLREDAAASAARNDEAVKAVARDAQTFKSVFQVDAWRASCDSGGTGARAALRSYREVLDHLSEGLRYYMSLQEAVKEHQQQCSDFAFTRGLQRDELKAELSRRARDDRAAADVARLNVAPPAAQQPGYAYTPPVGHPAYPPGSNPFAAPQPYHGAYAGAPPPPPQGQYGAPPPQPPPGGYPPQNYAYPQFPGQR
ncbi:hypothetical protein Rsub_04301 [Raphidocelis subcapitata]|uniref:BRO1 domain-containing protein n=1 Tax=Raphidocelis subcapitata TaxID=307507 RepID=A0A2V0NVB9_9CHLO|nr:hypothetical protein Rsub_04301 [Raphidocelis subcapitata]|eukprot:GBF91561.1 hypothetical protein Rsub_04301 [Raphidocelis subcapitata]